MISLKYNILVLVIVFFIAYLPLTCQKTHFSISMLTEGYLNKLLLISIVFLVIMEDYYIGLLLFILLLCLLFIDPKQVAEGFIPYFKTN